MDSQYSMPTIFTQDVLVKLLQDKDNLGRIKLDDSGNLVIKVVSTKSGSQEIASFPVHELNVVHDYTEYMAENFRRSEMSGEVEAYKGVNITPEKLDLMYCTSGLTSETAEVNKIAIRNFYFDKPINRVEMLSENGDIAWYKFNILKLLNFSIMDVLKANILKLKIRYPDKNQNIKLELKDELNENDHIHQYMVSRGID